MISEGLGHLLARSAESASLDVHDLRGLLSARLTRGIWISIDSQHDQYYVCRCPVMQPLDEELLKLLVCPRDKQDLHHESDWLSCPSGHRYRIIEGIPIL